MDSNTSAAETVSHLSGFSSAHLSNDTQSTHNYVKNNDSGPFSNGQFTSNSGITGAYSDGGSEDGGFVSGEEEFETPSEKPVMAEPVDKTVNKTVEGEDTNASFVDSLEIPMLNSVASIEAMNDNNGDNVIGGLEVRVFSGEDPFGDGEEGLKVILGEGLVKKIGIGSVASGENEDLVETGASEKGNSAEFVPEKLEGVEERSEVFDSEQFVETREPRGVVDNSAEGVKFTDTGDSVVNDINLDTLESEAAVVAIGDVKEFKDIEIEELEFPVNGSVGLENGFDEIDHFVEEPVELKPVEEVVSSNNIEVTEVLPGGNKIDSVVVAKHDNSDIGNVTVDIEDKEITTIEPKADSGTKQIEIEAVSIADMLEHEAEHSKNDQIILSANSDTLENGISGKSGSPESSEKSTSLNVQVSLEAEDDENHYPDKEYEIEGSVTDGETEGMISGSSEVAKQFLDELEQASGVGSHSGAESSHDISQIIDGQIVSDSDEEVDTDEEGEGKELFDSAALTALLKAATGADADGSGITITSQDGSKLFSVERPAGLGTSLRTLRPASRPNHSNLFVPSSLTTGGETEPKNLSEEEKKKLEKLQQLRVKFLRLVKRLGQSPEDSIAAQVLYRLSLVAGRQTGQLFNLDAAKRTAMQLEAEGKDDLDISLNILVLGKAGVGKSATINSIFGEEKTLIDAFEPGTTSVKEIVGTVDGVKIRVIDTPGLKSSGMEQGANRKVLSSIKKFTKKCSPDIVLYVDRLDSQTRDLNDLPLLRTISNALGSSTWRSAIVTLTHAASAPPDGPSGSPLSYEVFVAQRSHVVQQSIGQAVGDLRLMNPSLMNPVTLVENHPACRKNRDGQKVLPNGQTWRPQLLLLCYSMKILSEASSLSKSQDTLDHRKLFGFRVRSPPLPYLLSWLLQSRTHPKLPTDQGGDIGDSDIDLADLSDSDQEEDEDEYNQLPPFKPLRKAQIAKLSKEQRKAYFEEYDYRVKLLQKKQWKEELRRMREMKKKGKIAADDYGNIGEDVDQENGSPAAVPVPLPDMVLPPSFDGDNPAYRYRFLEPTSQFLARPVLDTHGWDHDCGYDGVNIEQSLAIASQFPVAVTVQVTKDKKEFNIHLDSSVSAKHGEDGSSMMGFDIQNVGKQLAYIVRGETKFKNFKKNKTGAGISVTFLGENVATGVKLEDQIAIGKRLILVGSTGTVRSKGDSAYGANLEVRLREADFPIGQDQSSLGLSLVKWRGDLALGANLQSQFSVGRGSKVAVRAGLNNKLSGQITVRTSTSDHLQIALLGIVPVVMTIFKSLRPGHSENYSMY
ncbi:translocase of chloroplast 159, chloroplastic-like [Mangifera indica]|uniref:translocase of chloroplast 159, chloroplastic-like n=1 Tax=Mangifera indica TaxID=29780 RepID=UPI001CFBA8E4|nr:translocase of chloroplast 159, chloroplastic-like [Mangifera indica]